MYYFRREEPWQKKLIQEISKELNLDVRVVRSIVYYPLLHLKHRMSDPVDETPVRIRRLGVWDMKTTKSKKE